MDGASMIAAEAFQIRRIRSEEHLGHELSSDIGSQATRLKPGGQAEAGSWLVALRKSIRSDDRR
jgi:hypothetical protein